MKKEDINIFGEDSIAVCEKCDNSKYQIRRLCDNVILAEGNFDKYKDSIIRTMYTGKEYASGDFILVEDINGETVHTFQ